MRVAIIENYNALPEKVSSLFVDTLFPNSRIGNINDPTNFWYMLESMSIEKPKDEKSRIDLILHHRKDGTIIKQNIYWLPNTPIEYSDVDRNWSVRLVEIDTTKIWTMDTSYEYDNDDNVIGSREYINYIIPAEPSINYYRRRSL